jgi:hypothetical protein
MNRASVKDGPGASPSGPLSLGGECEQTFIPLEKMLRANDACGGSHIPYSRYRR